MGFEYQYTVKETTDIEESLLLLVEELVFFHDEYMIFLKEKSENEYVYSIKFHNVDVHNWPEEGLIYLKPTTILVLFHTGSNEQRQLVLDKIVKESQNLGFEMSFEEL